MARELTGDDRGERKFTVRVEHTSECKRVLSISIDREELEREKAEVLSELRRDLRVPGFRKGKVPVKYIEKNYHSVIHTDAVRNLLPRVYEDALVREGIAPIGDPKFENVQAKDGEDVSMDVVVEVRPDIEVKGYRGVKVRAEKQNIDDRNVEEALASLQKRLTTLKVVDRAVRADDVVLIDYGPIGKDGTVDEKAMSRNYPVDLSGGTLLPEFCQGLLGAEAGEIKEIRVKYPEDFPEKEAAGTEKTFRVTVKEVKEKEIPELDDEFARRVGEKLDGLAALRERIRTDLVEDEEKRYRHDVGEQIIDRLIEANAFEVPETMIRNYLASVLEEDRRRRPNVADESAREQEVETHFRPAAIRTIKKYLILEAVRKQEEIGVDPAEIEARIEELAQGEPGKPDEVRQFFSHPERRRSLRNDLLDQKVLNFLREAADIKTA